MSEIKKLTSLSPNSKSQTVFLTLGLWVKSTSLFIYSLFFHLCLTWTMSPLSWIWLFRTSISASLTSSNFLRSGIMRSRTLMYLSNIVIVIGSFYRHLPSLALLACWASFNRFLHLLKSSSFERSSRGAFFVAPESWKIESSLESMNHLSMKLRHLHR